jgi:cytochrome c-type biogenesis protein CcmH
MRLNRRQAFTHVVRRPIETEAQAIFNSVLSPYCPGRLLAVCTSSAADDLRNDIRASLRAGESRSSIETALYRRFGDGIRAEPPMRGAGLMLWLAPPALLAASGWWLLTSVRRWSTRPPTVRDESSSDRLTRFDETLQKRLEAELDSL